MSNYRKMREALEQVQQLLYDMQVGDRSPISNQAYRVKRLVKAALTTPPRNCDVGTAEEQYKRCRDSLMSRGLGEFIKANTMSELAFKWAQMPYEEGEIDEKK